MLLEVAVYRPPQSQRRRAASYFKRDREEESSLCRDLAKLVRYRCLLLEGYSEYDVGVVVWMWDAVSGRHLDDPIGGVWRHVSFFFCCSFFFYECMATLVSTGQNSFHPWKGKSSFHPEPESTKRWVVKGWNIMFWLSYPFKCFFLYEGTVCYRARWLLINPDRARPVSGCL